MGPNRMARVCGALFVVLAVPACSSARPVDLFANLEFERCEVAQEVCGQAEEMAVDAKEWDGNRTGDLDVRDVYYLDVFATDGLTPHVVEAHPAWCQTPCSRLVWWMGDVIGDYEVSPRGSGLVWQQEVHLARLDEDGHALSIGEGLVDLLGIIDRNSNADLSNDPDLLLALPSAPMLFDPTS